MSLMLKSILHITCKKKKRLQKSVQPNISSTVFDTQVKTSALSLGVF